MIWVPAGSFMMGSDDHYPEEAPAHKVTADGFWIDHHTVTNTEFARFVQGRPCDLAEGPGPGRLPRGKAGLLVPASTVFESPAQRVTSTTRTTGGPISPGRTGATPRGRAAR